MAEYIEREAFLEVLMKSHKAHANNSREESLLSRDIRLLNEQPAADVVEVVRCKDCKYYGDTAYGDMCKRWEDWLPVEDDDFCSYGERRSDDEL